MTDRQLARLLASLTGKTEHFMLHHLDPSGNPAGAGSARRFPIGERARPTGQVHTRRGKSW